MSEDDASAGKTEIVIVRRRGGDDGAAGKGGAWKIAYADFVTAMMAFFLVMWLINASNEKTRAQVASYFNPIKLTDTSTGARSLKDIKDTKNTQNSEEGGSGEGTPPSKQDVRSEAEMLSNPAKALDHIATAVADAEFRNAGLDNSVEIAPAQKTDVSNPGIGDPFDPRAWEAVKDTAPAGDEKVPDAKTTEADTETDKAAEKPAPETAKDVPKPDEKNGGAAKAEAAEASKINAEAAAISREIASFLGKDREKLQGSFEVTGTGNGILISLTEQENFEMFETGSAEPRPEALKLVEAVASSVRKRDGVVVVRGHTDSRPYRNKYYDNWQLSTARAHFARYMLVRGGLDEKRIRKIEGVADRDPRNKQDPQAAENRRIEILIGSETP